MSDLHWIAGPPGAGKTTTLVRQTQRAVDARGRHAICIASLTRTASNHIADRAADALGEQALPPDACGTLHAHAYRTLDRPDLAETWDGLADWNREHPAQRLTPGSNDDLVDDDHRPGAQAVHARVMAHRNRRTPREQWTSDEIAHDQQWADYKQQTGRLDFCDLIEHAIGSVHHLMPSVWLIDEAQDLSRLELELAHSWIDRADIGVFVGDEDQCQPGDTIVRTTTGEKRIDLLDAGRDRLLSFDRHDKRIYGARNGGFAFQIASRPYVGDMLTVSAAGRSTRCTPNHRWPVQWTGARDACAVYLMRKGDRWRVGWCQIHNARGAGGGFHLGTRARLETADEAWILSTHADRRSASLRESIIAATYGLPTITFRHVRDSHYDADAVDEVFGALDPAVQAARATRCLLDHGRRREHPLWSRAETHAKRGRRTSWVVHACNLLPGLMSVAVPDGSYVTWQPVDVTTEAGWSGHVYSLNVEPHHTYVADGLATHNCLYEWRGADRSALRALPWTTRRALAQSYRVPQSVHAAAQRWIRRVSSREDIEAAPTREPGRVDRSHLTLKTPDLVAALAADADGQTMVLTHTRRMVAGILHALDDARVPYHNPYRPQMEAWNPLGAVADPLRAYLDAHRAGGRDWTWGDVAAWTEPLDARRALARGARGAIERACRPDRFGEHRAAQTVTLDELARLLDWQPDSGLHPAIVGDLDWWARHLKSQHERRLHRALRLVEHHGQRVLWETPSTVVGTIHSAKGGESDHVIIAPDISRAAHRGWAAGSRSPQRDPLLRLGYVALTRARQRATILTPAGPEHLPLEASA